MRNFSAIIAAGTLAVSLLPLSAQAQEGTGPFGGTLSAEIGVTTDYVFRGISQTDGDPALQGGVEYAFPVGNMEIYAGVWGSSINFGGDGDGSLEFDYLAGLRGSHAGLDWDAGIIHYTYPGSSSSLDYDFTEFALSGAYDLGFVVPGAGIAYSPDFFGGTGDAWYYYATLEVPVPLPALEAYELGVYGRFGRQTIKDGDDYNEWLIGIGGSLYGLGLALEYTDTDISGDDLADDRFVFTVSAAF
ncbi:TorF family putative porin [Telmatospirillum sp. J64-1]|uniref:TorF family putative porin n=1 Tax=Telmatospirillum sp. J64-1 TaxID=2502183 RepID=UPI00115E305C|nr:TorF family putative porin [Telmatospirillum sp. J64-1]